MQRIQNITAVPYQRQTLALSDGSRLTITMRFVEQQRGWFFDEISWEGFRLTGLRISNNPNMLYQWRNLVPFGIQCSTNGGREPSLQEDFFSGASKLHILERSDVEAYREYLNG